MNEQRTTLLFQELNEAGKDPNALRNFKNNHKEPMTCDNLQDYLNAYLNAHPELTQTKIISNANMNPNSAHQIFNGHTKKTDKYRLVALCIGAGMNLKETQRALKINDCSELYPKIEVDAGIIICINRGMTKIGDVEEFLKANGIEEIPFPIER